MAKYDINDPTDVDIMRAQFDMISHEQWEEYIELATERNMGYKKINVLNSSCRKAGMSKYLSTKVLVWVLSIVDALDESLEDDNAE